MDGYRADPIQIPCNGRMIERVIRFNESRFNSFSLFSLSFSLFEKEHEYDAEILIPRRRRRRPILTIFVFVRSR